jgi:hypothetical protein
MARRSTKPARPEADTSAEAASAKETAAETSTASDADQTEGASETTAEKVSEADKATATAAAKDDETAAQNDQTAADPTERREHVALCHVQMDGGLKAPGTPLLLTASEFQELKSAKAVAGDW